MLGIILITLDVIDQMGKGIWARRWDVNISETKPCYNYRDGFYLCETKHSKIIMAGNRW
jgi:hypothetical protein